jgi:hypothetical protein
VIDNVAAEFPTIDGVSLCSFALSRPPVGPDLPRCQVLALAGSCSFGQTRNGVRG